MRRVALLVFVSLAGAIAPLSAQDAPAAAKASPYVSVIGTVNKVDADGKVLTVKPDKGDETTVKFDERTSFMTIPAGETDLKKATPSDAKALSAGDRVVARVLTADPTGKAARTIYITKQADLAQRQQDTQEKWKNATSGLVTSIDPGAKQIKFNVKAGPAMKEVALDISGKVDFQRYNADSGKYEPSSPDLIKTGDQLRVLGQKNPDMTQIKAESVGFGSFRTIGMQVKTIDAAAHLITGTETASKKTVVIALRPETSLKKFTDVAALAVARQLNPSYQQAGGGRGGRGGSPQSEAAGGAPGGAQGGVPQSNNMPPVGPQAGGGAPGGGRGGFPGGGAGGPGGGMGRMGGGRGGMDINRIIEQQPATTLAELKAGDALIVTGATGSDPGKLTAIGLLAGVEPILRAAPSNGADPLAGSWSMGGDSGGGGGN
jgi:hypothetical protein